MKKILFIVFMLAGLAPNLTKDGYEIIGVSSILGQEFEEVIIEGTGETDWFIVDHTYTPNDNSSNSNATTDDDSPLEDINNYFFDRGRDAYSDDNFSQDEYDIDYEIYPNQGVDVTEDKADKIRRIYEDLIQEINFKEQTEIPFPEIIYGGDGYKTLAHYDKENDKIYVYDTFFSWYDNEGDMKGCIYHELQHEYNHEHNLYPYLTTENEEVFHIDTDLPIVRSPEELNHIREECVKSSPPGMTEEALKQFVDLCVKMDTENDYTYFPSNYWQDELSAREATLQGEIDGLYDLSDKERENIQNQIDEYKWGLERSLEFEKNNGYDPAGNKK